MAFSLATFLLSLAGIPPLPGFWGKLSLAMAALGASAERTRNIVCAVWCCSAWPHSCAAMATAAADERL